MIREGGATLILLGHRPGALRAARLLGFGVILIEDRERSQKVQSGVSAFFRIESYDWDAPEKWPFLTEISKMNPQAIIALTERTVVPAAKLRAILNVSGMTAEVAEACHDKLAMKQKLAAHGIAVAPYELLTSISSAEEVVDRLGLPIVVKTRRGSGGRGTVVCNEIDELKMYLKRDWLAERFVTGTEMSVESFVFEGQPVFTNFTEYYRPRWINIVPRAMEAGLTKKVLELNAKVISALRIQSGMTHLELFLGKRGLVVGEIAARPPGGYLMELLKSAYGFDPWSILLAVETGQRPREILKTSRAQSAVIVLHPGEGSVTSVSGVEEIQKLRYVKSVKVRVSEGDWVDRREGVGDDVGRVLIKAPTREGVIETLVKIEKTLNIS